MFAVSSTDKLANLFSFLREEKVRGIVADQVEEAMMKVPVHEQLRRLADVRRRKFFVVGIC